jgi:hypothetical protein
MDRLIASLRQIAGPKLANGARRSCRPSITLQFDDCTGLLRT